MMKGGHSMLILLPHSLLPSDLDKLLHHTQMTSGRSVHERRQTFFVLGVGLSPVAKKELDHLLMPPICSMVKGGQPVLIRVG
jgi:hypothetical protein